MRVAAAPAAGRTAGRSPIATAAVKPSTRKSMPSTHEDRVCRSAQEGDQPAAQHLRQRRAQHGAASPPAAGSPPEAARTSRPRDAPMACRTAISRSRTLARASSRFARLAQAISSTRPVVASSSQSGCS